MTKQFKDYLLEVQDGAVMDADKVQDLADELEVDPTELKRLPKLEQDLGCVLKSRYMFN